MSLCKYTITQRLLTSQGRTILTYALSHRTLFSRKKDTDDGDEERRKIHDEDGFITEERLNQLASKTRTLTTKKPYHPPSDVVDRIEGILKQVLGSKMQKDWQETSLKDPRLKYKVLSQIIREFDHDIPNSNLNDLKTMQDAVQYFLTERRETAALEDLKTLDLPSNLHIQTEPVRYNPETDTMFGGRTAFPGSETVVSSIKYKRKYEAFKTTKVKPGYENHYYRY